MQFIANRWRKIGFAVITLGLASLIGNEAVA